MKKSILIFLLAALFCFATACSQNESDIVTPTETDDTLVVDEVNTNADTTDTTEKNETEAVYTVTLSDGSTILLGVSEDRTLSSLGAPLDTMEAPSCVHEGNDCVYTFNGFTLLASPDGKGNQILCEFAITSDMVSFADGLTIGSDKAEVESVFGTEYTEQFGVLRYTLDGVDVSVILDDSASVTSLVITLQS